MDGVFKKMVLAINKACDAFDENPPYLCEQSFTPDAAFSLAWANTQLVYSLVSSAIATAFYKLRKKNEQKADKEMGFGKAGRRGTRELHAKADGPPTSKN